MDAGEKKDHNQPTNLGQVYSYSIIKKLDLEKVFYRAK